MSPDVPFSDASLPTELSAAFAPSKMATMFASVSVGLAAAAGVLSGLVTVAFAELSAIAAESAFGSPFEQAATSEIALTSAIPRVDRMSLSPNEVSPTTVQDRHRRGERLRFFEDAGPTQLFGTGELRSRGALEQPKQTGREIYVFVLSG